MTRKTVPSSPDPFDSVPVRPRADGWTPERQTGFIAALAQTANVEAACRAVDMGTSSAYALRARPDAAAFREAWQIALDYAVHQLADAALDRAVNGVSNPIFFKGEQIGIHRRFDEKLTMFILRLRHPDHYGSWREKRRPLGNPDAAALLLDGAISRVGNAALAQEEGERLPPHHPMPQPMLITTDQHDRWHVTTLEEQLRAHEQRVARDAWNDGEDVEDDDD